MRRGDMGKHGFGRLSILTARERQVAALAHRGLSNKLVAKKTERQRRYCKAASSQHFCEA